MALAKSVSICNESGKKISGKNSVFCRSLSSFCIFVGLCPQRWVKCPLRENAIAKAVPKEPAPNTVIEEWVKVVFIIDSLTDKNESNEKIEPTLSKVGFLRLICFYLLGRFLLLLLTL